MGKTILQTRQRLLQAALDLFREKGYAASAMAEILKRAQANSGSFYYFFRSKEDLLMAVLERYREILYPALLAPIWKTTSDPIERIFRLMAKYRELLVASKCTYGCPIGRLALEIDPAQKRIHRKIAENFDGWADAVEQCLKEAQSQGRMPPHINRKRLATLILSVMEGGVMQSRSQRSVEPFDLGVEELWQYIDLLAAQSQGEDSPSSKSKSRRPKWRKPIGQSS